MSEHKPNLYDPYPLLFSKASKLDEEVDSLRQRLSTESHLMFVEGKIACGATGGLVTYHEDVADCVACLRAAVVLYCSGFKRVVSPLDRQVPCGCVICICEDPDRCHGCGGREAPACQESRLAGGPRHVGPPCRHTRTEPVPGAVYDSADGEPYRCLDCKAVVR